MAASDGKIVVFDLGGVLVRICRTWQEGCAAAGLPVRDGTDTPEMVERRRALSWKYQRGEITCDGFFEAVSETTGGAYTPDEIAQIHDAWLLGLYDGVEDVVERLAAGGTATGILSNTNHRHWERMKVEYAPLTRARHPHASHLLGLAKPEREIYQRFQCETGFEPSQIIFFDDLEENVLAAREAGWTAHHVDYERETAPQILRWLDEAGVRV